MSPTICLTRRGCGGHGQNIGLVDYFLYLSLLVFVEDLCEALVELRLFLLHFCKDDGKLVFELKEHRALFLLNTRVGTNLIMYS